jgi:hypothetical protein
MFEQLLAIIYQTRLSIFCGERGLSYASSAVKETPGNICLSLVLCAFGARNHKPRNTFFYITCLLLKGHSDPNLYLFTTFAASTSSTIRS